MGGIDTEDRPCEDEGRHGREAATSPGCLEPPEAGRDRKDPPQSLSTFQADSGLEPPEAGRDRKDPPQSLSTFQADSGHGWA